MSFEGHKRLGQWTWWIYLTGQIERGFHIPREGLAGVKNERVCGGVLEAVLS